MSAIDNLLDRITLYRLTLYYLIAIVTWAVLLSALGVYTYNPLHIAANTLLAVVVGHAAKALFSRALRAQTGGDSNLITALILVLIIPVGFPESSLFLAAACVVAVASKYALTVDKQHVCNPAAVAVVAITLLVPSHAATWWVGSPYMLGVVAPGGLLVVRKLGRGNIVLGFVTIFLVLNALSFVMITEPSTLPPSKLRRLGYAAFVATLYSLPLFRIGIDLTPEIALCISNVLSFVLGPKHRFDLALRERVQLTPDISAFRFDRPPGFTFTPGQFMEWIVPHKKVDSRGARRYFTIASSPTEEDLMLLVRFSNPGSTYKRALLDAAPGARVTAFRLAGDFVLPRDLSEPVACIAGGVGVAPFRSMVRYIVDRQLRCDMVLFFINRGPEDVTFMEFFEQARPLGVKTTYVMTRDANGMPAETSRLGGLTDQTLRAVVPDYSQRRFYIAGPQAMVDSCRAIVRGMGVSPRRILTDYFQGFADRERYAAEPQAPPDRPLPLPGSAGAKQERV
jgi:ferredoxin-NADP reductase